MKFNTFHFVLLLTLLAGTASARSAAQPSPAAELISQNPDHTEGKTDKTEDSHQSHRSEHSNEDSHQSHRSEHSNEDSQQVAGNSKEQPNQDSHQSHRSGQPNQDSQQHGHQHEDSHPPHSHPQENNEQHSSVIPAGIAAASGIRTAVAGPGVIVSQAHLFGVISAIPEVQLRISAPYAGVVQQIAVRVGDKVKAGQLLARVQNSATLKSYAITAPQAGEVTARFLNSGEKVTDQPLLEISDFSEVYLELSVFPTELARLKTGQPLWVYDLHQSAGHQSAGHQSAGVPQLDLQNTDKPTQANRSAEQTSSGAPIPPAHSQISYIAPQMTAGHIARARAILDNRNGRWRPGMHVQADVTLASKNAAVRIEHSALQKLNQQWVVFVRQGDQYLPRPVQLGLRDDRFVEVQSGLGSGETYVVQNSFLIKADLQKSSAGHQH